MVRSARRLATVIIAMMLAVLLASGVVLAATTQGTTGQDVMDGTAEADKLNGHGDDDTISGLGGVDKIEGGPGNDRLFGGNQDQTVGGGGADSIKGGPGNDAIVGGSDADTLNGHEGDDSIYDGPEKNDAAVDKIQGDDGNDFIVADNEPASKDEISCGAGTDEVRADSLDVVADDCEVKAEAEPKTPPADAKVDINTNPAAEGTMPSADNGDAQAEVFGNCTYLSENPHLSTYWNQVSAKARTSCSKDEYNIYTGSDFYRWRWWGWSWLDGDAKDTYNGFYANTNTRYGCNYNLTTWYKIWSYHYTENYYGWWSDSNSSNGSNEKYTC